MKLFAPFLLSASLLLAGPVQAQVSTLSPNTSDTRATEAQAAASTWLASFDTGDGADNWLQSASVFKERVKQEDWEKKVDDQRTQFGRLKTRTLKGMGFTRQMDNAPDGEYFVMRYLSTYAKKDNVVEIVVPTRDRDGNWKIANYVTQ
jgi:hypothetical protein